MGRTRRGSTSKAKSWTRRSLRREVQDRLQTSIKNEGWKTLVETGTCRFRRSKPDPQRAGGPPGCRERPNQSPTPTAWERASATIRTRSFPRAEMLRAQACANYYAKVVAKLGKRVQVSARGTRQPASDATTGRGPSRYGSASLLLRRGLRSHGHPLLPDTIRES